jgi:hypothetical protein
MSTLKEFTHNDPFTVETKYSDPNGNNYFNEERLGELRVASYSYGEAICQFVEAKDSISKGDAVGYSGSAANDYQVKQSSSADLQAKQAGIALAGASAGSGIWIQKTGPNLVDMNTDGTVSSGDQISKSSSSDGQVTASPTDAEDVTGVAYADDSSNTLSQGNAYLDFPL